MFYISDLLTENQTISEPRAVRQAKSLFGACKDVGKELAVSHIMKAIKWN